MEETLEVSVSKSGGMVHLAVYSLSYSSEKLESVCVWGGISPCLKGKAAFSLSLSYISDTPGMEIF